MRHWARGRVSEDDLNLTPDSLCGFAFYYKEQLLNMQNGQLFL